MRHHPKQYENISKFAPKAKSIADMGSRSGTLDDLIATYRNFYKSAHIALFDLSVRHVWLEHQYTYRGLSRGKATEQGYFPNKVYGYFMKNIVGVSHKPLTENLYFTSMASYFSAFFPKFYEHNPFEETGYFKFPYKNISIDHMSFVYQCEERLDMLAHAESLSMTYGDFRDWAMNHVLCENPSGYELVFWHNSSYIKKIKPTSKKKRK